ncbi:MAG TPA: Vms1/Ankzf1 family peptidyl-tRNA hydrolase [Bryobacteraceae bacterium]|jgi:peptide subunit release factor 1 (eRF1)
MAATPEVTPAQLFDEQFQRLLDFEPTTLPVVSLYLNTQPDDRGRDHFEPFLKREFAARSRTFAAGSAEAESFERDTARIRAYIEDELKPSANGLALFACAGAGEFFEAVQLNAPVDEHRLYVYNQPHLYHLARLDDEYPRYAALLTDANSARIFVFGLGEKIAGEQVKGKKVQRVKVGGWSQARYQRRVENAHRDHAKESIDALDRIVREEKIEHVVIAGDPAIVPVLQEQLPKHLAVKVADTLRLDAKAPEQEIFEATLDAIREKDAATDAEKVARAFEQYRAGGLAVAGSQETLEALANGQVDELLISAALERTHAEEEPVDAILAPEIPDPAGSTATEEPRPVLLADLLVTKAKQTAARVSFIEDPQLLAGVDGVAAFLRWRS